MTVNKACYAEGVQNFDEMRLKILLRAENYLIGQLLARTWFRGTERNHQSHRVRMVGPLLSAYRQDLTSLRNECGLLWKCVIVFRSDIWNSPERKAEEGRIIEISWLIVVLSRYKATSRQMRPPRRLSVCSQLSKAVVVG
jgi:hypothetical protein